MCKQSAVIIALQFIPTFWLFLLPLAGAVQSGMLPVKLPSSGAGAAMFLCFPGIPFFSIFFVFLLAAMMVVDAAVAGVENPILV